MPSSTPDILKNNEFFKKLYLKFDKALSSCADGFEKRMNHAISKVEQRLQHCETALHKYVQSTRRAYEEDLNLAETLVNKELRSKVLMSQWVNHFLCAHEQSSLDAVTFSIARFSLNLALTYHDIPPEYAQRTGLARHLVDYVRSGVLTAAGPALMALTHLSLHDALKACIVQEGAMPVVLKVMYGCKSKPVLALCAKLCASLALEPTSKFVMAQSGCFHVLIDLILGAHCDVDESVTFFALCAIVNTLCKNDSNRMLAVELNCIKPLITTLQSSANEDILIQSLRVLANISFANGFTANNILIGGAGEIIVHILQSADMNRQPVLVHAALSALSNICHTEVNQVHVGNIEGMISTVLQICRYSKTVFVTTEAANLILGCCWKNSINKSRVAHSDGCPVLLDRIMRHAQSANNADILCTERLCLALSSVLIHRANHERMHVIRGLENIVSLCKTVSDPSVLRALGKVIIPMIPSPQELLILHKDQSRHMAEKTNAVSVLKKIKLRGYSELANPPEWLELAIELLSMTDADLRDAPSLSCPEFCDQLTYSKEFSAEIRPDATVFDSREFRGLIFSIY